MAGEEKQRAKEGTGLFPSTGERVPPPARIYAAGGAMLAIVLVVLIVEFFISAHHASDASQIVIGVLFVVDVAAGAWLLSAAERRQRCIYEWRSDALELLARYRDEAERMSKGQGQARITGRYVGSEQECQELAVETREQVLLAQAALRDTGAYADASVVGDARRLAGLTVDQGSLERTTHDPLASESFPEDAPERGSDD